MNLTSSVTRRLHSITIIQEDKTMGLLKYAVIHFLTVSPHWLTRPLSTHSSLLPSQVSYRSSSKVCRTSLKESASRLLISSFRYRIMKGIVLSSLKRRIMLAQTQSSILVLSDKTCKLRILSGLNIYMIMYGSNIIK